MITNKDAGEFLMELAPASVDLVLTSPRAQRLTASEDGAVPLSFPDQQRRCQFGQLVPGGHRPAGPMKGFPGPARARVSRLQASFGSSPTTLTANWDPRVGMRCLSRIPE